MSVLQYSTLQFQSSLFCFPLQIVFGGATKRTSHESPDMVLSSQEAVSFYNAMDKYWEGVENLAVVKVIGSEQKLAISLSHALIQYFSRKLL